MTESPRQFRLDQFLKYHGIADTGGVAKLMIQGGEVLVNGETEERRRRKLTPGDVVVVDGNEYLVEDPGAYDPSPHE